MPRYYKNKTLTHIALIIALIWSALLLFFAYGNITRQFEYADELALSEAQVSVKKDLAYRSWVASHGGVYVPITERTPPSPYLAHIPNRDVTTDDGQKLTLMNPAYTLSQMMRDYSGLYGIKGKITSHKLYNPANAPDSWEQRALEQVERTAQPFYEKSDINATPYVRYMNPMITKADCLKCHAHQGYKVGDIRGGVSVSVPLEPLYAKAREQMMMILLSFGAAWLIGLLFIYLIFRKIRENIRERIEMYENNIYSLVDMIEQRDSYTAGHTRRVADYARLIAQEMQLDERRIDLLYRASMLHDIGKISTPDSILLKPGALTPLEYDLIQEHVSASYAILKNVDIFAELAEVVRHHHERYDGQGYPQGLRGDEIPLLSSIMTVADAFDAMTTNRIYKARKSIEEALLEVKRLSGSQFHPEAAAAAQKALLHIHIDEQVSQLPVNKLEAQRFAYFYTDQLTGVYNRDYLEFVLSQSDNPAFGARCAYAVYLRNFSQYNRTRGWNEGNHLLERCARALEACFPDAMIFRLFGDDFIVLHPEHHEPDCAVIDQALEGSGIEIALRHFDLHGRRINLAELEMMMEEA